VLAILRVLASAHELALTRTGVGSEEELVAPAVAEVRGKHVRRVVAAVAEYYTRVVARDLVTGAAVTDTNLRLDAGGVREAVDSPVVVVAGHVREHERRRECERLRQLDVGTQAVDRVLVLGCRGASLGEPEFPRIREIVFTQCLG